MKHQPNKKYQNDTILKFKEGMNSLRIDFPNKSPHSALNDLQILELEKRRNKYLSGEGVSYTWEEVKQKLRDNHGLSS